MVIDAAVYIRDSRFIRNTDAEVKVEESIVDDGAGGGLKDGAAPGVPLRA